MTGRDQVSEAGFVAVDQGRIVHVGRGAAQRSRFPARETIGSPESVVMPGLVNAHTHVGDQIYGTLCGEADLTDTLYEVIFPLAATLDADLLHAASRLGVWDALRSGVTTICDLNVHAEATARASTELGCRAVIAEKIAEYLVDAPPRYDRATRSYELDLHRAEGERTLALGVAFVERWRGHDLITPALGPHAPDHLSTAMLQECARAAESLDVKLLPHLAQSPAELAQIRGRGHEGTIRYLASIGFLSPRVHGAHMVLLDDDEIDMVRDCGMSMSFNPASMLACRSFPPIDRLMATGMAIGFGTDNVSFDIFRDLRYGVYAANLLASAPDVAVGAYDVLHMATAGGATAIGLGDEIGTLEVGKRADIAVVDFRDAQLAASTNPVESLAYLVSSRDVSHTIVGGRVVHREGELQLVDQRAVFDEGRAATATWLSRNREGLRRGGLLDRIAPDVVARTADRH